MLIYQCQIENGLTLFIHWCLALLVTRPERELSQLAAGSDEKNY